MLILRKNLYIYGTFTNAINRNTMKSITRFIFIILIFCSLKGYSQHVFIPNPQSFFLPEPISSDDSAQLGALMPRTMHMLHKGKKVKIAIYGQSLSDANNTWWVTLGDALKVAYPEAEIDIRTFGVGGVASSLLWRLTNQELVAFHPDLVIFHVYGHHTFYETIIRQIRGCTTAEIIIQGDHIKKNDGTVDGGEWDFDLSDMSIWDNKMTFQTVKGYCDTYNLERNNRRQEWYDYLKANDYLPDQLVKDNVHFNDTGQWLVAALTARHFVYDSTRDIDPFDMVTYYEIGKDVQAEGGKIILPFEGNKVELVPVDNDPAIISAIVDGKKPSEYDNCYYFTIPNGGFWNGAPFLKPGMGYQQEEDWVITMTGGGDFTLTGDSTGNDGSGNKDDVFVSDSKRIVLIGSYDWGKYGEPNTSGNYNFSCKGMFNEQIDFSTVPVDTVKEYAVNVIQGLENESHTLELTSSNGNFPIKYIKVYKPPYKLYMNAPDTIEVDEQGGVIEIPVQGNTFWQACHFSERLSEFNNWNNIELNGGAPFAIDDQTINITCNIDTLAGDSAFEYVRVYGQGANVKNVVIHQFKSTPVDTSDNNPPDTSDIDDPASLVDNDNAGNEPQFYPNPATHIVNVANINGATTVYIYSINGSLKGQMKLENNQFDVSALKSGVYAIKIIANDRVFNEVLVKE